MPATPELHKKIMAFLNKEGSDWPSAKQIAQAVHMPQSGPGMNKVYDALRQLKGVGWVETKQGPTRPKYRPVTLYKSRIATIPDEMKEVRTPF